MDAPRESRLDPDAPARRNGRSAASPTPRAPKAAPDPGAAPRDPIPDPDPAPEPSWPEAPPLPEFPKIPPRPLPGTSAGRRQRAPSGFGGSWMGMMSIGMGFVSMAAGGAILGWLVDYFAGTKPVGLLVGVVVGVVSGGWRMVKATSVPTPPRGGKGQAKVQPKGASGSASKDASRSGPNVG